MDFKELFLLMRPVLVNQLKWLLDCRVPHKGLSNEQKVLIKKALKYKNKKRSGRPHKKKP